MRNQRGFTLMEVLVSIAIMAVLGTALTALLRSSMSAWREGEARASTNATAQTALDQIDGDFASAATRPVQPPGPVIVEIPTVEQLLKHRIDYYSNEWCTVSVEPSLPPPDPDEDTLYLPPAEPYYSFDFQLRFPAKRAAVWVAYSGEIDLEAKIYMIDNQDNDGMDWHPLPESGDLSGLIEGAAPGGAERIGIRATFVNTKARLMPGTEGPVLRFVAEPNEAAVGIVRFLLARPLGSGEPQRVVFVRNFGGKTDPFAPAGSNAARSLGEICYITTADTDADGHELPGRTLWRTVRQPVGDWSEYHWYYTGNAYERDESVWSYTGNLMDEIDTLYDHVRPDGKVDRQAMAGLGFHPIADNVLHFSVEAWRDAPNPDFDETGFWTDNWEPDEGTPRKIRIILTLIPRTGPTVARLTKKLSSEIPTDEIEIESTAGFRPYAANSAFERFVKIGDEWVYYDNIKGSKLLFDERDPDDVQPSERPALLRLLSDPNRPLGNRGLTCGSWVASNHTAITEHNVGTDVYQGETYVRTIILPYPRQIDIE